MKITLKLSLGATALAILCACSSGGGGGNTNFSSGNTEISFPNIGNNGIFDPSIEQDSTGKLWMSYSEVNFPAGSNKWWHVGIRIASSNDGGANWADAGLINNVINIPLAAPWQAVWQQEVSRIVDDSADAGPGRRWKMLWHRYIFLFNTATEIGLPTHDNGWISLKVADTPDGLAPATERKLFTGYFYDNANDTTIGQPEYPLASLHAGLSDCGVFTEPGMLPVADGVYVVLRCTPMPATSDIGKIVLLKCLHTPTRAFDACAYLGNFLLDTEAADHGAYDGFSAPDIVRKGSKNYLIVTPTDSDSYKGCLVFEISDLASATLVRSQGKAVVVKSVNLSSGAPHHGACGYHTSATQSGILYGEADTATVPNFRLFESGTNL